MQTIKCVVVGDVDVGKTELLLSYTNLFSSDYVPTVIDHFSVQVNHNRKSIALNLWDTSGQEDYEHLRLLAYPQTDIFLVCFSITSPASLENVKNIWCPEIKYYCPNTPFFLVGTHCILREDPKTVLSHSPITFKQGAQLARTIGAVRYVECFSNNQEQLKKVFEQAIHAVLGPPEKDNQSTSDRLLLQCLTTLCDCCVQQSYARLEETEEEQ